MSAQRQQRFDSFVSTSPTFNQVVDKVRAERDVVDKTLTWARLKYLYVDYQPYRILSSLWSKDSAGNTVIDEATKTRYGWTRWQEIRAKIDIVDNWLSNPSPSSAQSVLKSVMVEIPDAIDYELEAWGRNTKLVKEWGKDIAKGALDAGTSLVTGIALPIAAVYALATLYDYQKKRK